MFDFLKKKKDNEMNQIQQTLEASDNTATHTEKEDLKHDTVAYDIFAPTKKQDIQMPIHEVSKIDFETIEIKTRPNLQSGFQLATFADLSSLSRRTSIFVFRDKKQSTYFGIIEGKIFYLKK